jgi:hypothetical protein
VERKIMFEKHSKVLIKKGEEHIHAILDETEYYTVDSKSNEISESHGTASWPCNGQQEAIKISLTNGKSIICSNKQKFFVDYAFYGSKEVEAYKLTTEDDLLCLHEEHYYNWYDKENDDDENLVIKGCPIKSIESINAEDLEFYDVYVQSTNTCIVNYFIVKC